MPSPGARIRGAGPRRAAHIVRATLESVAFQTRDLLEAMASDVHATGGAWPTALRVDGGMVANDWLCQLLADRAVKLCTQSFKLCDVLQIET